MKKVFFFGTGHCAEFFADKAISALKVLGEYEVMGFLDNDVNKIGTQFGKYKIYSPDILKVYPCDLVLLFLGDDISYESVFKQLAEMIPPNLVHEYFFPLKALLEKNYRDSDDEQIKDTLKHISNNKVTVFNQFIKSEYTYDEVKWDKHAELPYIDFTTVEGRVVPMYYPRDYKFVSKEEGIYVENLLWEQSPGSPHLYTKQNHDIKDGDCIIDAGVCEGNFALKYIDMASHIYLFEMDPAWWKPLHYTFRNYENKITLITRAISDKTSGNTCKIDDIVPDHQVDFLKMDIEGAEVAAVCGAKQVFDRNNLRCSICAYHKNGDEKKIRQKLEEYGYRTTVSDGYMLFLLSDDTWVNGDLRRGIVYGNR